MIAVRNVESLVPLAIHHRADGAVILVHPDFTKKAFELAKRIWSANVPITGTGMNEREFRLCNVPVVGTSAVPYGEIWLMERKETVKLESRAVEE